MTLDLTRERRIRANLAELRRMMDGNPERARRIVAWLAEQEVEEMKNEDTVTLRLPSDLLEQVDELVPIIGAAGDLAAVRVTRSTVIRLALIRGIGALREEFGGGTGTPKKKGTSGRAK